MQDEEKEKSLYKTIVIAEIKEEVKDFKTFVFANNDIHYKAGQYLTLVQRSKNEEVRRSYSITSSPDLNEPLSIGIRRIENGLLSRQLIDHAKPGDSLTTTGAGGLFVLPDNILHYRQLVFLAAGSGITPIFSLLKTALQVHPHLNILLVYSNTSEKAAVFLHELQQLQIQFASRFTIEFLFSNNQDLSKARLHKSLLETFLKTHVAAHFNQTLFYICGPMAYMRMCSYVLQEAHVPAINIKKENFIIERINPAHKDPPDKAAHMVTITMGQQKFQFATQFPDTILKSAKKHHINLPFSCEAGRCGNCIATCTNGKVWLSNNDILTEKDLEKGLTLTCVGYPLYGDVELSIKI